MYRFKTTVEVDNEGVIGFDSQWIICYTSYLSGRYIEKDMVDKLREKGHITIKIGIVTMIIQSHLITENLLPGGITQRWFAKNLEVEDSADDNLAFAPDYSLPVEPK